MLPGPRVFSLAEWPVEVGLVTAARMAELSASGGAAAVVPQPLSRSEALWLFDRCASEAGAALRAFVQANGAGPALSLSSDAELVAFVRREIAAGALLAFVQGTQVKRLGRRPKPASDSAPTPIRRAPPPPAAAAEPQEEDIEFMCPGPQALTLLAAAEEGAPFCEECARAAALRAGAGAA